MKHFCVRHKLYRSVCCWGIRDTSLPLESVLCALDFLTLEGRDVPPERCFFVFFSISPLSLTLKLLSVSPILLLVGVLSCGCCLMYYLCFFALSSGAFALSSRNLQFFAALPVTFSSLLSHG